MSDAFISYRRKPSASLALLVQTHLKTRHGLDAYVDTTRADSTRVQFPERLMAAIEAAPTFICLLGSTTLDSEWVRKEIQRAYELHKHCIPVFQESYVPPGTSDAAINYLLNFDGVHVLDEKNVYVDEAIGKIAALIPKTSTENATQLKITSQVGSRHFGVTVGAGLLLLIAIAAIVVFAILPTLQGDGTGNGTATPTDEVTPFATTQVAVNLTPNVPTLSGFQQVQTAEAEITQGFLTEEAFKLTATEQFVSNSNSTATAAQFAITETSAYATLFALSATATPTSPQTYTLTPSVTATLPPLGFPGNPVTNNAEWKPFIEANARVVDGVSMVMVPAGCFMMGSTESQIDYAMTLYSGREYYADETPAEQVCFDAPFWIDRTEVTNGQYGGSGEWDGDDLPRETVSWFEAKAHCENRGARLPTEAEWEYAARGPDSLIYPWGNEFVAENVVYSENSGSKTAPVASRPGGVSWVGAYDLSGNVWEWVSTIYDQEEFTYPYATADGREDNNTDVGRVFRGGSWDLVAVSVRTAIRDGFDDIYGEFDIGFRCALS